MEFVTQHKYVYVHIPTPIEKVMTACYSGSGDKMYDALKNLPISGTNVWRPYLFTSIMAHGDLECQDMLIQRMIIEGQHDLVDEYIGDLLIHVLEHQGENYHLYVKNLMNHLINPLASQKWYDNFVTHVIMYGNDNIATAVYDKMHCTYDQGNLMRAVRERDVPHDATWTRPAIRIPAIL
jgi:hypothetical protein